MAETCSASNTLPAEVQHSALLQLLANSLILCNTTPYLACADILNLAATSQAFRYLVYRTPQVFRRLELSTVKSAQLNHDAADPNGTPWRNGIPDDDSNVTEDE